MPEQTLQEEKGSGSESDQHFRNVELRGRIALLTREFHSQSKSIDRVQRIAEESRQFFDMVLSQLGTGQQADG